MPGAINSAAKKTTAAEKNDEYGRFMNSSPLDTHSPLEVFGPAAQLAHCFAPVILGRSFRTASGLPQDMSQRCDVLVAKGHDAVLPYTVTMRLLGMLIGALGMFKSLPGEFLPGLVILLPMRFLGASMTVGSDIVQFSRPLVIFVV